MNILKLSSDFFNRANEVLEAEEYARQYQVPLMAKRLEQTMAKNKVPGEVSFIVDDDVYMALFAPENDELGAVMGEGKDPYSALSALMMDLINNKLQEFKNYLGLDAGQSLLQ